MTDRKPQPSYGDEQIELALIAVAYSNGNTRKASGELKSAGLKIPHKTLWRWSREQHVQRYEQVRTKVLPPLRARAAENFRDIAARQASAAAKMTDRLEKEVDQIDAKDLPKGVQAVTTAAAISVDKAEKLDDQPTQIIQHSPSDILRALKGKGLEIDGEVAAEEDVTPAQLPV